MGTSPGGGIFAPERQPDLQHGPRGWWASGMSPEMSVGLTPLPLWMSPVVAWMSPAMAHQVLERGWRSGWHQWFLLGEMV